ncbi:MAG: sodium:solute symporter [Crocinitomicaceae bacterium]|nr:sodium:solute symporter [Crocinitomicaceae bacterium]
MTQTLIISVIAIYFLVLIAISFLTSRKADNSSFFLGERKSPWYIVSFGMIGASLSGVTFISVPGWVGDAGNQFSYMQAVLGYLVGYFVVAYVLLPIYYRMNLTSIYEYLNDRFGFWSYKTGATFFLVSRILGASFRLLLVANVLQSILFDDWGIPFPVTVIISVLLIWIYTSRGGIKTIVWTDTLQTAFMLVSVFLTVWFISNALDLPNNQSVVSAVADSKYSQIFFFDDFMSSNHFLKHFLGGIFITIGMTGLDQDMMQKNLSCKNLKEAKKNMISMAFVLVFVNLVFLFLGALLYMYYSAQNGVDFDGRPDLLFSNIAMSDTAGKMIGILFLLGLIAAAYSSADSALTSLTTSFSIDFLGVGKKTSTSDIAEAGDNSNLLDVSNSMEINTIENEVKTRKIVHVGMSIVIILVVILLKYVTNDSVLGLLMKCAGFTYGPLIGIFFFGILTKRSIIDKMVPYVSLISIAITFFLWYYSAGSPGIVKGGSGIFGAYKFGFEIIILNSFITFICMLAISKRNTRTAE